MTLIDIITRHAQSLHVIFLSGVIFGTIIGMAITGWVLLYADKITAITSNLRNWIRFSRRRRKRMKHVTNRTRDHLMATTIGGIEK